MAQLNERETEIILIEAFYGGSHKQLMDLLATLPRTMLVTMPAKKWHWRARTAAVYLAETIPHISSLKTLFTSSVLNLCELTSLRPDLATLRKIMYFHENQLIYPVQQCKDRDFQYGYNQIVSCLVADVVLFNSKFNMDSFLSSIITFLNAMPDHKPRKLLERIRPKCSFLYFPIEFRMKTELCIHDSIHIQKSQMPNVEYSCLKENKESEVRKLLVSSLVDEMNGILHIVWPHRWEHDKNPALFFNTLFKLKDDNYNFKVSVLGEQYSEIPEAFQKAKDRLQDNIIAWGYQQDRDVYHEVLHSADVVVSTANHEFYGVAMLEAVNEGCFPLCPNRLVYPEIYPQQCLYNTDQQLYKKLKNLCDAKKLGRFSKETGMNLESFSWKHLKSDFMKILHECNVVSDDVNA